ncbi:hypothetical protein BH23GEM2_BH23GEM2_20400 [soil metagenome]
MKQRKGSWRPLTTGEWGSLTATVLYSNGSLVRNPYVKFTSDRPDVVSLWEDTLCAPGCGYIYLKGLTAGEVTITAEFDGLTTAAQITVVR